MNRDQLIARAQAAGIDVLVCAAAMLGAGFLAGLLAGSYAASLMAWGAGVAYSLIEVFTGASIGKVMGSLQVVAADGRPSARKPMLRRWAIKHGWMSLWLAAALLGVHWIQWAGFAGAGVAAASFLLGIGHDRQAWHDLAAGTQVRESAANVSLPMAIPAEFEQSRKAA
jgi:uncharacterized RDD family membrane protein YckC